MSTFGGNPDVARTRSDVALMTRFPSSTHTVYPQITATGGPPCFVHFASPCSSHLPQQLMPPVPSRWKPTRRQWPNSTSLPSTRRTSRQPQNSSGRGMCSTTPIRRRVGGAEGAYITFLREKFPDAHSDVIRVFADGD